MKVDINQSVAKGNGSETAVLTRRSALIGIAASVAGASIPSAQADPLPTREDLEDYFVFLWAEHRRVAEELGIDVFDHLTLHSRGGLSRYKRECAQPAAARALRVLSQAGMAGGAA